MNKARPGFIYKKCMACRICIQACPFSCLESQRVNLDIYRKAYPELVRPEDCTGCGICAAQCPFSAIRMEKKNAD